MFRKVNHAIVEKLVQNLIAGIAYAVLAKVDAVVGLYTSLLASLVYMVFGTSRHSSIGVVGHKKDLFKVRLPSCLLWLVWPFLG